jgi:RimJ/RimL family protein N-acetyltransferase
MVRAMVDDAPQLPGEPGTHGDVTVRRWRAEDAQELNDAVAASREHLLPWMPWAGEQPDTLARRRERIGEWEREWRAGGDCVYGIFVGGALAGGCGLHRRLGPGALEIGYWLAVGFTGRGVMTIAGALLTDAAFSMPEIGLVEVHHDKANEPSAGVPRRLGFTLVRELAREPQAPGEVGVECQWQITRGEWLERQRR